MGSAKESRAGRTAWLLSIVIGGLTIIYDFLAIWFLIKDYAVVHSCKASNRDVHVVWPINLWVYVLMSVIASVVFAVGLVFVVPLKKSADAIHKQMTGRKRDVTTKLKYGYLPSLPDWLLLAHGSAMIGFSCVMGVLAFCGYSELFVARPWCEDKATAFEELDLWHFGRVTFFLQIIFCIVFLLSGVCYWMMPFFFELNEPEYGQQGYGSVP